jgi:hypothetical protein
MMDGINAGGQTSAPKAAWYETIKPAVASTLTLAVTGAFYGAVSGAVQDATSALLKASPPSKSGADLNAGALPLAALVVSGLAGGVCGWNAGKMAYDRINEKDWLGDWGQAGKGMRVLVAAGVGGGTAAAVFMGTAIASLYAVGGGSADYSENDEARDRAAGMVGAVTGTVVQIGLTQLAKFLYLDGMAKAPERETSALTGKAFAKSVGLDAGGQALKSMLRAGVLLGIKDARLAFGAVLEPTFRHAMGGATAGLADALWTLVSYRCDPKFRAEPGARVEARSAEKALVEHFAAFKDGALMDLMQTPVAIVLVSKFGYTQGILVFTAISSALAGASKVAEPWHGSGAAEPLVVHVQGRGDEETGLEMETGHDSGNPSMNVTGPTGSTPVVPTVRSRSAQNSPNPPVPVTVAQGSQSPVDKKKN